MAPTELLGSSGPLYRTEVTGAHSATIWVGPGLLGQVRQLGLTHPLVALVHDSGVPQAWVSRLSGAAEPKQLVPLPPAKQPRLWACLGRLRRRWPRRDCRAAAP
ncbi:hypothetical protein ACFP81_03960 [Deinococcus lacus]|uniref:Uncharacterized protein n=1 Tax=Deinococcus lacus TaxID=392561 RepID=A0ABW1YBA8_9DEIO